LSSEWFSQIAFSAALTTGKTSGLPSSVLYAPTPRLTFFGFLSALNPIESPRIASTGAYAICDNSAVSWLVN